MAVAKRTGGADVVSKAVRLLVVGAIIVFLISGLFDGWATYREAQEAEAWIDVPCRVVSVDVREVGEGKDVRYFVDASFEYAYEGKTYRTERYSPAVESWSSMYEHGPSWFLKYQPPGSKQMCRVDPDHPAQATFRPGKPPQAGPLLFVAGMIVLLVLGGLQTLRPGAAAKAPGAVVATDAAGPRKPVHLAGEVPRWLVATAIVGVVLGVWGGNASGWSPTSILVLLGGALGPVAVFVLVDGLSPRPVVDIELPLTEGVAGAVSWRISERLFPIRRLEIYIEGAQVTIAGRRSKRRPLYRADVVDTHDRSAMAGGQVDLLLPALPPGVSATDSPIIWTLFARCHVRFMLDIVRSSQISVSTRR